MTKIKDDDPRLEGLGPGMMRDMLKKQAEAQDAKSTAAPKKQIKKGKDD